jgi:hypothetical protein
MGKAPRYIRALSVIFVDRMLMLRRQILLVRRGCGRNVLRLVSCSVFLCNHHPLIAAPGQAEKYGNFYRLRYRLTSSK